jgi:divalent metal cation (Fe/Co/Zn/Cd) transporter
MDECGGCCVPLRSLAGTESRDACIRWGQRHRTLLSGRRLWRFRASAAQEGAERRAARVAGTLLFALAAYVAITSVASLLGYSEPKPTLLGIAILIAAAAVMPWLAREKRRLSGATRSAALRADAAQSALCAYLSLIALAGLAINAFWSVKWADPVAALLIVPLVLFEGWEAIRGEPCNCC